MQRPTKNGIKQGVEKALLQSKRPTENYETCNR